MHVYNVIETDKEVYQSRSYTINIWTIVNVIDGVGLSTNK